MLQFSITNRGKGRDSKILFPGKIYYNFVPYKTFEGKCREDLIHIIVMLRR